jgi:hypothetical protein
MSTSIPDNKKSRGRPRTGVGTLIGVRMPPNELALLDRFIAEVKPDLSRPEALRFAFRDWAVGQGLAPHGEDPEGAN